MKRVFVLLTAGIYCFLLFSCDTESRDISNNGMVGSQSMEDILRTSAASESILTNSSKNLSETTANHRNDKLDKTGDYSKFNNETNNNQTGKINKTKPGDPLGSNDISTDTSTNTTSKTNSTTSRENTSIITTFTTQTSTTIRTTPRVTDETGWSPGWL